MNITGSPVTTKRTTVSTVDPMNHRTESPIVHVFATPELLGIILNYYYEPYQGELYPFGFMELDIRLVNKLWCQEASKAAFKSCNIQKLSTLKQIRDNGANDYGPLVVDATLDLEREEKYCMTKFRPFNLKNLTSLLVYSDEHDEGIYVHLLSGCSKLEHVQLNFVYAGALVRWLTILLEMAPCAKYCLFWNIRIGHEEVFRMVSEHPHWVFYLTCENYEIGYANNVVFAYNSLKQYPQACRAIKYFRLEISDRVFMELAAKVSGIFDFFVPIMLDLELCLLVKDTKDDIPQFVWEYVKPIVLKCKNLNELVLTINNELPFHVDKEADWIFEIHEWAKQVVKHIPSLRSLSLKIAIHGEEYKEFCEEYK